MTDMTALLDLRVRYDLAESTCPPLAMRDLAEPGELADVPLGYGSVDGDPGLRALIADGTGIDPGQVLVTAGAIEAMFLLAHAVCGPGDRVLLATPCFPPALTVPEHLGVAADLVPLAFDDGYRLPVGRLAAALTARTRLVSLASPQNPSGVRISETELGDVLDAVREKAPGAVVLVDETYRESTYGRTEPPRSVAALVPQVVTCSSLSKAFGAPGLRIGWLTTTDPTLHAKLRDAKFRTSVSCSTIDEFLGARVLEKRAEILAPRARRLGEALDELLAWADGQPVDIVEPDGGALCCLRLRRGEAAGFYDRLAALETRVGPGSWFGEQDRVFRVGFGHLPAAEFTAALHCLAKAL